jgi:Zn-dependent metalloprotease
VTAATDEAYDGLGATYDLYLSAYDRHSVDDAGLPLPATVHYGRDYDNAFWDGSGWSSATGTASCSTGSPSPST